MNEGQDGNSSFPLNETHLQALNTVLDTEQVLRPLLKRCKDCGLPVDQQVDTLNWQIQQARAIKAAFFPNHP